MNHDVVNLYLSSKGHDKQQNHPVAWIGPSLVCVVIQVFQTGVLLCLHITFWGQSREGKLTRCLVAFISLVGLFQTCLSIQELWQTTVTNFGNWEIVFSWSPMTKLTYIIIASIAVPVQVFLSRRCWLLWGKRWFLLVMLGSLTLAYVGVTIAITIEFFTMGPSNYHGSVTASKNSFNYSLGPRFSLMLIMPVVLDTVLTLLLMIKLLQLRSGTYTRKFRKILKAVTMLTWETAVPPSACAIVNAILYGSGTESSFWFKVFREILGKLYIISLMVTLNSRGYLSELEKKEVTLQLPSMLPVPVTDRTIRTQPRTCSLNLPDSAPAESNHVEGQELNEEQPASYHTNNESSDQ